MNHTNSSKYRLKYTNIPTEKLPLYVHALHTDMHTRVNVLSLESTVNCLTFTNYVHRIQESGRLADVGLQLQRDVSSQFWGEVTTLEGDASGNIGHMKDSRLLPMYTRN